MNSNMVKPEIFGHLHLVYHFTVPSMDLLKHPFSPPLNGQNRPKYTKRDEIFLLMLLYLAIVLVEHLLNIVKIVKNSKI